MTVFYIFSYPLSFDTQLIFSKVQAWQTVGTCGNFKFRAPDKIPQDGSDTRHWKGDLYLQLFCVLQESNDSIFSTLNPGISVSYGGQD